MRGGVVRTAIGMTVAPLALVGCLSGSASEPARACPSLRNEPCRDYVPFRNR